MVDIAKMSDLHQEKVENQTENEIEKQNDEAPSFTQALREKYCFDNSDYTFGSCQITFHGKAGTGGANAELAHLRNVVLCNANLKYAGIPREGLASLCPNVIDLDISGNNLTSWKEVLPIFQQLTHLKFVNLGGNSIQTDQEYLETIHKPLSNVENLVLNGTFIPWKEVLKFVKRLPALKEIHVCYNNYEEFGEIGEDDLQNIECFRANNNNIQQWSEVWKLRHLPKLQSLILSGNPVKDIFYDHKCCPGNNDDCQEPMENCDSKNISQNRDKTLVESADQNSSCLSASSCDTSESSEEQSFVEEPSDISKQPSLKTSKEHSSETSKEHSSETSKEHSSDISEKQPSESSKKSSSETSKEQSPENVSQNMISDAESAASDNCSNFSMDQSSKDENEEQKSSADVPTTDRDEASTNHEAELEEEFQAMVSELLTVANKIAHSKLAPNKGTNRHRYDSLQSEDGDYDDCPKQMGQMTKLWGQMPHGEAGQMQAVETGKKPSMVAAQMTPDALEQMQPDTMGQLLKDGQMQPDSPGQMQPDSPGQMQPDTTGQIQPDTPGQIPSDTTGQTPSGAIGQMPSEGLGQMPPNSKGQIPTEVSEQTPSEALKQMSRKEPTEAADDEPKCKPFQNLQTLCLTETDIHHTEHLEALTKFPSLKSVRLRDVPLYKEHNDEVSWKLYLASLPNIELFNGSEISSMDRENSERFYVRHYLDFEEKPKRHEELERKHGKLSKIVDIDIGANFQKYAMIQFYMNGKKSFTKKLCMRDSVDKLRTFLAKQLKTSKRNFRLYFFPCGPDHVYENGEFPEEEKLVAYLPMSRFNMRNGDEIHIEMSTNIQNMESRVAITESRSRVPRF